MQTVKKHEDFTRAMYQKAVEVLEMAEKEEIGKGIHSITFDTEGKYINVMLRTEEGVYEIVTFGDNEPKLRLTES